ncbi:MAG: glycosyltransferase, partial [Candidatus Hydrothermarchaeaceae archaeon]
MQMLVLSEKVPQGMEGVTFDKILKYAMAFESEFDKIHVITSHDYSARAGVSEKLRFHRAGWRETGGFLGIFTHILYLANVFCTGFQILRKEKDIAIVTNSWGHCTMGLLAVALAKIMHRKSIVRVAGGLEVGAITAERRYGLSINAVLLMLERTTFRRSDLIISVSESIFET